MKRKRQLGRLAALLVLLALQAAPVSRAAETAVLYDGALGTGTPDTQGFFYQAIPPASLHSFAGGVTTLDTSAASLYFAGYVGRPTAVPVLDRASGYQVRFSIQIAAEEHVGSDRNGDGVDDRAGFAVIALSSDRRGIELDFWKDRVWAQEYQGGTFFQAEGRALDAAAALRTYLLTVQGDTYTLAADGAALLSGPLRDYSGFGAPYTTPNFIFLGDNTSSASGTTRIASVSVTADLRSNAVYVPLVVSSPQPSARVPVPYSASVCAGPGSASCGSRRIFVTPMRSREPTGMAREAPCR